MRRGISRLLQRLARLLYPYGMIRHVLVGPARGQSYVVALGMGATYALGAERRLLRFLAERISSGAVVYDIGANRGQFTLVFARAVGASGRVVAFEPLSAAADDLGRNLALNGFRTVETRRMAVGAEVGVADFHVRADAPTEGCLDGGLGAAAATDTVSVAITTLDAILEEGVAPPDLLKIDVEGAAGAVLRGAARMLEERAPAIYLELHGDEERAAARDQLQARGYRLEALDGTLVADPTAAWVSPLWCTKAARDGHHTALEELQR